ncbi:MAG: hypothetical protein AB7E75_03545 [Candidatus Methanomethylophilaceae archaeon]|jgi:Mn-dependent DtxR family transcriptional regulator
MPENFSEMCPNSRALLILFRHGKVKRSDFEKKYGFSYRTASAACERLEDLGLTKYEALGDRRDTVYWSLTEKGEKAAEMLAALDEFIRTG